jgi:hypothetical protein
MMIFILIGLALPTWFLLLGFAETGALPKGKLTKYLGINRVRGVEEYRVEDYYG